MRFILSALSHDPTNIYRIARSRVCREWERVVLRYVASAYHFATKSAGGSLERIRQKLIPLITHGISLNAKKKVTKLNLQRVVPSKSLNENLVYRKCKESRLSNKAFLSRAASVKRPRCSISRRKKILRSILRHAEGERAVRRRRNRCVVPVVCVRVYAWG